VLGLIARDHCQDLHAVEAWGAVVTEAGAHTAADEGTRSSMNTGI
jgi:hypothetical protein